MKLSVYGIVLLSFLTSYSYITNNLSRMLQFFPYSCPFSHRRADLSHKPFEKSGRLYSYNFEDYDNTKDHKELLLKSLRNKVFEISEPNSKLEEKYIKASGPGGQKINKSAICVQLNYSNPSGSIKINIKCKKHRTLILNRIEATEILIAKINEIKEKEIMEIKRENFKEAMRNRKLSEKSKFYMMNRVLLTLIFVYFNINFKSWCFLNYYSSSRDYEHIHNVNDKHYDSKFVSVNALDKSKHKVPSNKSGKYVKSKKTGTNKEDLDSLFAKDNDERKLIKEINASRRYFSEKNNPLMRKIEHSNQIISSKKIKKLAERAGTLNVKSLKEKTKLLEKPDKIEKKSKVRDSNNRSDLNKITSKPHSEVSKSDLAKDEVEKKVYKRTKISEKELNFLPLKAPGIRALEPDSMKNVQVEEIESLIKLGYDGIIDMNSLFKSKTDGGGTSDSEFIKVPFKSLGIYDEKLIEALKLLGIDRPTYAQKKFIPKLTEILNTKLTEKSRNLITSVVHASTGSGKTLMYMLPIFQSCLNQSLPLFGGWSTYNQKAILGYVEELINQDILVICPSLELCVQSSKVAKTIYEQYKAVKSEGRTGDFYSDFSKILAIPSKDKESDEIGTLQVETEIKPTLLIGNANILYQKKNIKKIMSEKAEEYEEAKTTIQEMTASMLLTKEIDPTPNTIKRTVAMYFATPGRLYSILFDHKLLNLKNFRYVVLDEYDSYLEMVGDSGKKIKNARTKDLINKMFKNMSNRYEREMEEDLGRELKENLLNLRRKYVMCVSASDNLMSMPGILRKFFLEEGEKNEKENENSKESCDSENNEVKKHTKSKTSYQFPKNILHTMAIYSVPDAKLSLLRKILKSVPYNKSVLIFCDSNVSFRWGGTASFLLKYLSGIFGDSSIQILNSVQNRIIRRKAFSNIIQTNIDNTNLYNINKKTTKLVKDILISTRLNSRGIDFSGYTHVINYDLPHGKRSLLNMDAQTQIHIYTKAEE
ncbi:Dead/deah box RNA helicase, putative [Theileria annulata]|uniref:ATP-dependent RNA helicase n=1 Tax=Theileria annulata TaxID=5874 RepID=Q4UGF8_THEAN|nr:Dead/deah box RNA helicase, putative [Theileria annulata]CAI73831.1 Dead/deah box RNA helicase, putative [Theileria annulata]|eukprot:XP_954508.1 Dead/deah box RNA helicase, putative [Theileria annulata]